LVEGLLSFLVGFKGFILFSDVFVVEFVGEKLNGVIVVAE
jgi:hypothetical protein